MDTTVDLILSVLSLFIAVAVAIGLAFWTKKAQTDRSAYVGIYLLFGIPGGLLTVAGLALVVNGLTEGPFALAIGLALLLPLISPFRKLVARYTPYDPKSPIDLTGLTILLALIAFLFVSVLTTGGSSEEVIATSTVTLVVSLIVTMLTFVSLAYISVGYRFWRNGYEATQRLGIRKPSIRVVIIGIAYVIPVLIMNLIGGLLTQIFQPDRTADLDQTMNAMTDGILNPAGALLIGLTAGIGEELFFRGALLPRFGIVLTSFAFALLHTQYELTWVLLGMFGIGILLGLERQKYGTVAAIITHATMNIIAVFVQIWIA